MSSSGKDTKIAWRRVVGSCLAVHFVVTTLIALGAILFIVDDLNPLTPDPIVVGDSVSASHLLFSVIENIALCTAFVVAAHTLGRTFVSRTLTDHTAHIRKSNLSTIDLICIRLQ
jgi:hypothetical protein